jgi:palmitoyl-protein thioesterase
MGGNDVGSLKTTGSQAEKDAACCAACSAKDDCQAWVQATDGNGCWLKTLSSENKNRNSGRRISPAPIPTPTAKYRPVVLMHGMGATGESQFPWQALEIKQAYPGIYVKVIQVDGGTAGSQQKPMEPQLQDLAHVIQSDPLLQDGFNLHGESQGGLLSRAYVQRFNSPRVHRLSSLCGPQAGVGHCPSNIPIVGKLKGFCDNAAYGLGIYHWPACSFCNYWKDVTHGEQNYLSNNVWLAELNNERPTKNETYRQNMQMLDHYYMTLASDDEVVEPRESAYHQFWAWGDKTRSQIVPLQDDEGFAGDWIGLKTLMGSGRLTFNSFDGPHTGYGLQWFRENLLPIFNDVLSEGSMHQVIV